MLVHTKMNTYVKGKSLHPTVQQFNLSTIHWHELINPQHGQTKYS